MSTVAPAGLSLGWPHDGAASTLPVFSMIGLPAGIAVGAPANRSSARRW